MTTKFLNIDLDIRSESCLDELLKAFGTAVIVLNHEEGFASIEVNSGGQSPSIDEVILAFYDLVLNLPPEIRAIWDRCEERCMNIGIQAGTTPYAEISRLSNKTLSRLMSINAEVAITVYAPDGEGSDA